MISGALVRALGALSDGPVRLNVSSAKLVTYKAGGPIAVLVEPRSIQAARSLWAFCHREGLQTLVLGKGANLLVADSGFEGVAFRTSPSFAGMAVRGRTIDAGAGVAQAALAHLAADRGLSGGEFLAGIPGTIGGGVCMNAGSHGAEIADIVRDVRSILPNGEILTRTGHECEFGARRSVFQRGLEFILSVRVTLSRGDGDAIRRRMRRQLAERKARQPGRYPNCGSVFKNPPNGFAWKLIDDAGLRGHSRGGAQVSEKHANFIANRDRATATEIITLIRTIQETVLRDAAVALEPELVIVGRRGEILSH